MAELFPHVPSSVVETLEFATDVRRARSGEMRDSLKDATVRLALGFIMEPDEAARSILRFRGDMDAEWYVPLWGEASFLSSGVSAGAGSVSVETDADYRAGGFAVIWKSETENELVEVASATGGTLTFGGSPAGPVASYAGRVIIAPVGRFIAPEGMRLSREYPLERVSVNFRRVDPADLGASTLPTLSDSPVVTIAPEVVQPLEAGLRQQLELLDSGLGAYATEQVETYVRERSMISFADATHSVRWARKQLLHYLRGRDRAFWLPTFRADLDLQGSVLSGATSITVAALAGSPAALVGRGIQFSDGSNVAHSTITSGSTSGSNWILGISAPGTPFPSTAKVSLMTLQRLDSDQVDIRYEFLGDDFIARCRVPTVEVPA